jgi:DNA-binding response OmpR family regulator
VVIVLLDDDATFCAGVTKRLEQIGHDVWVSHGWGNLPALLTSVQPDLMLVGERLTGISSKHLLESSARYWPDITSVVLVESLESVVGQFDAPAARRTVEDVVAFVEALRD